MRRKILFWWLMLAAVQFCMPSYATDETVPHVLIHLGNGPTTINNLGLSDIDKMGTITCEDAKGCVIVITSQVYLQNADGSIPNYEICSVVDGAPAQPLCHSSFFQAGFSGANLQNMSVATGPHTVQTQIELIEFCGACTIGSWEINYTTYDSHRVKIGK